MQPLPQVSDQRLQHGDLLRLRRGQRIPRIRDQVQPGCVDVAADAGGEPLGHRHHQRRGELVAAVVAEESVDALPAMQPRLPGTRANRTVMDRPPSGRALVVRVAW